MRSLALLALLATTAIDGYFWYEKEPEFENLGEFLGLAEEGRITESCDHDPVNDKWLFVSHDALPNALFGSGTVESLPGHYPLTDLVDGDFMEEGDSGLSFTSATEFVSDNQMYINRFNPANIAVFNTEDGTTSLVNTIDINSFGVTFGANGMCYDEERDILYVTNLGLDVFGLTGNVGAVLTSSVTKIVGPTSNYPYVVPMDMTNVLDINGDSTNGAFRPNGCTVAHDGKAYFASTFALGMYDPETDEFVVNTNVLTPGVPDGIEAVGRYLIMDNWGTPPVAGNGTGTLSYYDLDDWPNGEFVTAVTGLESPGDMGYNSVTGVFCVPSVLAGNMYFIRWYPAVSKCYHCVTEDDGRVHCHHIC